MAGIRVSLQISSLYGTTLNPLADQHVSYSFGGGYTDLPHFHTQLHLEGYHPTNEQVDPGE
jgi:hypothetical protein